VATDFPSGIPFGLKQPAADSPPAAVPPGAHCTTCAYELTGLTVAGLCPECGASIRASLLLRTWPEMRNAAWEARATLVFSIVCTVAACMLGCSGSLGAALIVFCLPAIVIAHTYTRLVAAIPPPHRSAAGPLRALALAIPVLIILGAAGLYAASEKRAPIGMAVAFCTLAAILSVARNHVYLRTLRVLERAALTPTQPLAAHTVTNIALGTLLSATSLALFAQSQFVIIVGALSICLWTIWSTAWAGSLFRISEPRP
jgi:hypothetical protein